MNDKPEGYSEDNGFGKPTHLLLKNGEWLATPKGYRHREDGLISHKWLRDPETGEREWVVVPTTDEIDAMVSDSVCESPWGDSVEPDHPQSWLRILGLI